MTNPVTEAKPVKLATLLIIIVALLLMFAGFRNGEHASYFMKAIMVCSQCIGLG
ncbi:MAG: hypothetical protein CVV42_18890 [Candidatus Riflebacteria bacterium HGW-Riflebacteria-2]|jgi:hypothetical protein|nr:MAG: hypothetical protein CVV42_18890 [Candidatus Riflebacteria bacterium HGW-Riflebacteria-2]